MFSFIFPHTYNSDYCCFKKLYLLLKTTFLTIFLTAACYANTSFVDISDIINVSSGDSLLEGGHDYDDGDDDDSDDQDAPGCKQKKLDKGYINLCVQKKDKVKKICVKQKKADKLLLKYSDDSGKKKVAYLPITFYEDVDGDTYGSQNTIQECELPQGYADRSNDCNDNNATINPGAADGCPIVDGLDNDCDGVVDNGVVELYSDLDQDTYGDDATFRLDCPTELTSDRGGDCNDNDATINPQAIEVACDDIDNDCTGGDEQNLLVYNDIDGDGFGDASDNGTLACEGVQNNLDCNDSNGSVNPGANELCNDGVDNNCNGQTDEGCTPICGNGVVETGEQCDDGGIQTANCEINCNSQVCGDGILNTQALEECDDNNNNSDDGCSANCKVEVAQTICPCWTKAELESYLLPNSDCSTPRTTFKLMFNSSYYRLVNRYGSPIVFNGFDGRVVFSGPGAQAFCSKTRFECGPANTMLETFSEVTGISNEEATTCSQILNEVADSFVGGITSPTPPLP